MLGGRFVLPEGSVILALRDTERGIELRLDVLIGAVPDPPQQMFNLFNMAAASRAIANPRPVPLGLVVKKGSNSRGRFSPEMPGPSSETLRSTISREARQ